MIKISCYEAKQNIYKVIANHNRHNSFFSRNPLNSKSTPMARAAYERNNSLRYEFKFNYRGTEYTCFLESIVCCPNNKVIYREHFVVNSEHTDIKGIKKLYKLIGGK